MCCLARLSVEPQSWSRPFGHLLRLEAFRLPESSGRFLRRSYLVLLKSSATLCCQASLAFEAQNWSRLFRP